MYRNRYKIAACAAVGILLCAVVLCAWTQTVDKATAQARLEALTKRTAEIDSRQAALKTQYADLLTERDKLRRWREAIAIRLERVEKQLEGYVRETEALDVESATSTEQIAFLKQGLAYLENGAVKEVPLTPDDLLELIAKDELGATGEIEVKP